MNAAWIMVLPKRQKVASQEIRCNLLDDGQRVCVAIFNEGAQELAVDPESVVGRQSKMNRLSHSYDPLVKFQESSAHGFYLKT